MKINSIFILVSMTLLCSNVFGQDKHAMVTGTVSFATSKNIYVKFKTTEKLNIGDTLRFLNQKRACLVVKNKSSKSAICISVFNCEVKKGDELYYYYTINNVEIEDKDLVKEAVVKTPITTTKIKRKKIKNTKNLEKTRGKLSVASYSNFSDIEDTHHRVMYRFSLDAKHINNSKFSFESYLNYRQYIEPTNTSSSKRENIFNVYNLALKYAVDSTLTLSVGRKINNKTSSLGAIDGLQVEKFFGNKYIGAIVGSRPDINDYSFNSNLLEYGGYIGSTSNNPNFFSQTTLGVLQQNNNGQIDRRYAYFQHSSTLVKKLNLFSSLEFDLYQKMDTVTTNSINLTNLYISAKYKFSRKLNLMVSYDSRKRILYYETFQTEIERLLNDNEARQGLRLRMGIKPSKLIYAGLSYSKRFQSSIQNKSDNINAYITLAKIPSIGGRLSINFNNNTSNYLESTIISIRHSRELIRNKLSADFYFRTVDYNYFGNNTTSKQNYYGTNLSLKISRSFRFNIFGELSTDGTSNNKYRINTSLIKRFNNKRKK